MIVPFSHRILLHPKGLHFCRLDSSRPLDDRRAELTNCRHLLVGAMAQAHLEVFGIPVAVR